MASAGIQTAALSIGGAANTTEEYDGSSWSSGGTLPSVLSNAAGAGIQTSALVAAGNDPGGYIATAAIYNGSSWTALSTPMATARVQLGGSGTSTSALVFGGEISPGAVSALTEEYNDNSEPNSFITVGQVFYNTTSKEFKYTGKVADSWATANNASTARYNMAGTGTQTAQMSCGGEPPPGGQVVNTEEYDGTNWTNGGNLPVAKRASAAFGTQTSAVNASGLTTNPGTMFTTSEEYDGSSWTSGGAVNTGRNSHSAPGS